MEDKYMLRAIELAKRGEGYVNPNPLVGCVVVKDGRIVSEGWHEYYGGYHAERNALLKCKEDVKGAKLYVTLEPCCHTGKTPPCTDIIIDRGIGEVFVGSDDPNPLVAGKGIEILRDAGIKVHTHVLKNECDRLNEIFFHYITTQRPYVAMKYAMTLDGKITLPVLQDVDGTDDGLGTVIGGVTITGEEAHQHVHLLRKKYAAILVGIGTVLADDPMLNVRLNSENCDPIRIILDDNMRLPLSSKIAQSARKIKTILVHTCEPEADQIQKFEDAGIKLMRFGTDENGHADLEELFSKLGEEGIDSVLVEGGSHVHGSLLDRPELINRVYAYVSPKLFGGETALSPVGGTGVRSDEQAPRLVDVEVMKLGEDILVTGRCGSADNY